MSLQARLNLIPHIGGEILGRGYRVLKGWVVDIDEFVIKLFNHIFEYQIQVLDVEDHTRLWGGVSPYRDTQDIVMPMAVWTDAFAKDLVVFLCRKGWIPIAMRGFELYKTRKVMQDPLRTMSSKQHAIMDT